MNAITRRAFSRNTDKMRISFAENMTAKYQHAELLEKSSGGMSFIAARELKPGAGILIRIEGESDDSNGGKTHPDYLAEVRWCVREPQADANAFRVGVRLFSKKCTLCNSDIRDSDFDGVDVCEDCRNRVCSTSRGKIRSCVENYLLGNVI